MIPCGRRPTITAHDLLATAKGDRESVLDLTRELVAIPSRGGIDPYDRVLDHVSTWLAQHRLPSTILRDDSDAPVALACKIRGAHPGPTWVVDACLDTAPFGHEDAWTHPPTKPVIADGWLWGRGSADSKAAVAIFSHIATHISQVRENLSGTMVLLFDVDEHTGKFGGAKAFFEGPGGPGDVGGVMIGYPGLNHLIVGGRGVYRTRLHVHGVASHSGGRAVTPNAIQKAAQLIERLSTAELPSIAGNDFPLPAKLTVTAITGGDGYTATPDLCSVSIDIRTTPAFDDAAATQTLRDHAAQIDKAWPTTQPTLIEDVMRWPPYALPTSSPLRSALLNAAESFGVVIKPRIAGPSNIGNYLAGLNIDASAGFGVDYHGLHGTDERIRIDSIPEVQAIYHAAIQSLLTSRPAGVETIK
ncbi:M20 family metallopeptidase [Nocardia sp. NPDC052278]|uniref:M20 family metallopeptidase n=1 Tax=unclassified Nocardia TaxID=2637762 RepID=UPI0036A4976B